MHRQRSARGSSPVRVRSIVRVSSIVQGVAFALLLILPGSQAFGQEKTSGKELVARRARVESLSGAQKERLARNFETFQQLSAAEKEQYRQLDTKLKADKATGGELTRIMQQYHEWLKTLDLNQRDQLRNEKDPLRRQELVYRFRTEQEQRRELAKITRRSEDSGRMGDFRGLSSGDLSNVMRVIEFKLRSGMAISPEQDEELNRLTGVERYRLLLEILGTKIAERSETSSFDLGLDEIVASIKDREQRDFILSRPQASSQRMLTVMLTIKGLVEELRRQEPEAEGGEILKRFFESLPPERQEEVKKLAEDQRTQRLLGLYTESLFQMFRRGVFGVRPFGRPGSYSSGEKFRGEGRRGPGRFGPRGGAPGERGTGERGPGRGKPGEGERKKPNGPPPPAPDSSFSVSPFDTDRLSGI